MYEFESSSEACFRCGTAAWLGAGGKAACGANNLSTTDHPSHGNSAFANLSHQTHCTLNPPGPICDPVKETFIGEAITPEDMSFSASPMAAGKPGLPGQFSWKGKEFSILEVLEEWKEAGDCRHGSGERYVRKHWFRVKTTEELEMKIYFERQGRSSGGSRWRLYSVRNAG